MIFVTDLMVTILLMRPGTGRFYLSFMGLVDFFVTVLYALVKI